MSRILVLLSFLLVSGCLLGKTERNYAVAQLQDTKNGKIIGVVTFTELKNFQTQIDIELNNLSGDYVLHIHEYGDLTGADYTKLGKIFDPLKNRQRRSSDVSLPVGLLGVIEDVTINYKTSFVKDNLALQRRFSVIGRALVLHDLNSKKVAVGVIARGKSL